MKQKVYSVSFSCRPVSITIVVRSDASVCSKFVRYSTLSELCLPTKTSHWSIGVAASTWLQSSDSGLWRWQKPTQFLRSRPLRWFWPTPAAGYPRRWRRAIATLTWITCHFDSKRSSAAMTSGGKWPYPTPRSDSSHWPGGLGACGTKPTTKSLGFQSFNRFETRQAVNDLGRYRRATGVGQRIAPWLWYRRHRGRCTAADHLCGAWTYQNRNHCDLHDGDQHGSARTTGQNVAVINLVDLSQFHQSTASFLTTHRR